MGNKTGKLNTAKYQNALLYFIKYCNNSYLGSTKLNKLMYYFDFISYRDRKKSVSGDIYIHKDYGPIPDSVDVMLAGLQEQKKVFIEIVPYKDGYTTKFHLKKDPVLLVFDKYEKKLLGYLSKKFDLWSTEKIVSQTHLEAPWFYSKPYDVVNYRYSSNIEFFKNDSSDVAC